MAMPAFMSNDAGAVKAPAGTAQRHPVELAHRPDGVKVAQQQNLRRAASEFSEQVVAAVLAGQAGDASADRLEPARPGPRHIDPRRPCRWSAIQSPHERFGGLENPSRCWRGRNRGGL